MAHSAPDVLSSPESEPRVLSFDEVVARHEGEWVLWKVAALEGGWPSHGEVLAHSPSRSAILAAWAEARDACTKPGQHYVFRACRDIRTGDELREALEVLRETWDGDIDRA